MKYMKKKTILIISSIIVLFIAYFGYKGFNLYYFTTQDFEISAEQFNISDTITLKHKDIQDNDYFQYKNIKIRNDFKEFEQLESNTNVDTFSPKFVLKDATNNTSKSFWMGIDDPYVYLLKADKTLYGTNAHRITNTNLTSILEKNNIHNDVELFHYLSSQKNVRNNIFTSVQKMKENYAIQFMISVIMPTMDSITLIHGDYEGYIFNLKDNTKEVSILKNDKRYVFIFISDTTITNEYLTDILSTIVIE